MKGAKRLELVIYNLYSAARELYSTANTVGSLTEEQALKIREVSLQLEVVLSSFETKK